MIESTTIFVYGCSNIFLERLAGAGGAWSHGDLEHVSIAFMFIGGGLVSNRVEVNPSSFVNVSTDCSHEVGNTFRVQKDSRLAQLLNSHTSDNSIKLSYYFNSWTSSPQELWHVV